jgi:deferrochelatase/peroxidase EfeB
MKFAAGWPKYDGDKTMMRRDIDTKDIQAIAKTGFGSLKAASYMLLRVVEPHSARRWLRDLAPASLVKPSDVKKTIEIEENNSVDTYQIAFTAAGLRKLGIDESIIRRFSAEFVEGMAGDENRSRRLGDIGKNAPEKWCWGVGDREPHILLILLAKDAAQLAALVDRMLERAEANGLSKIDILPTSDMGGLEPFGFVDGGSQPSFDWDRPRTPGTKADLDYTNLLALGELLLGYRNEYGLLTERPLLAADEKNAAILRRDGHPSTPGDLGLNGSYLVFRQLDQHVPRFWQWVASEAARVGVTSDEFAESMVGRKLDGKPLADLTIGRTIPGVEAKDSGINGFLYDTDPEGLSCPLGSHIRRANPRTGDAPGGRQGPLDNLLVTLGLTFRRDRRPTASTLPWPRNTTVWPFARSEDDAVASARFHRILRRGREYGERIDRKVAMDPVAEDPEQAPKAGIHFICLNANIARQFEFIQAAWIATAKFAALTGEQDPLLGNREPFPTAPFADPPQRTDGFSRPSAPPNCRHSTKLPQFINVRGGAYFFLPSLTALRWIASD